MKKGTKKKIKTFTTGALCGALILVTINYYSGYVFRKYINDSKSKLPDSITQHLDFKNEFPEPKFEDSFSDTKEVEQHTFNYRGKEIKLQADVIRIHSFNEEKGWIVEEGEKVTIPVENNDYLLKEYISQKEENLYKALKNKDRIKNQFSVYVIFKLMEEVFKEYLNREPFYSLENRKDAIYKIGHDYIVANEGYTIGGYKYSELNKSIQKDILQVFKNINNMNKNKKIEEKDVINKLLDNQVKALKYELFRIGR